MLRQRLMADFHLGVVVVFGIITVLGITPFAINRYLAGQYLIALLDTAIMASIGAATLYALRTGRSRGAAVFAAVAYSLGVSAVVHLAGWAGLMWVYPTVVANFLLVGRPLALLLSLLTLLVAAFGDALQADPAHRATFLATATMVGMFSLVFATRTERQRMRLETMALRDPLTGASNRRGMEAEVAAYIAASRRNGTPLAMLVFDIDHFKCINDDFGHEAGDQVLVQLARIVRANTRGEDRLSRLGGEEFGLLLPVADAAAAWATAEKLRLAVERELRCHGRPVTISVGAAVHRPDETAAEWMARADAAMYEAKRGGRNRTVVARDDGVPGA